MLKVLVLAALLVSTLALDAWVELKVVPASFEIKRGKPGDTAVAWGSFDNKINETGFGFLEIYTNEVFPDEYQAYAAGFLEAYFTKDLVAKHFSNQWSDYCDKEAEYCKRLYDFLSANLDFMNEQAAKYRETDPYWHQVDLILNQLAGLNDGLNHTKFFPSYSYVNVTNLLLLNVDGDLEDLEGALKRTVLRKVTGSGSCSALVKVLPGAEDLYFSQVTWSTYASMLRILKKYSFKFHSTFGSSELIPGHTATFSSSPGRIFSGDDFYLISSGLATMETTNLNFNTSLYRYVKPTTNLEYVRNIAANRLATSGEEWTDIFSRYNSGTYNNQWMVVDYKKFTPGKPLQDDLLWVLEQLPGYIYKEDLTKVLRRQTYWPSYNVPYSEVVFNMSNWQSNLEKFGDWFTYDKTPRALIFKRDNGKVVDMESMIKLMRYNDYTRDPLSACNCTPPYSAENAISARSDLNPADGVYPFHYLGHESHGATNMKLTNSRLFADLMFTAVAGPTYDPLPPFRWSTSGLKDRHDGQPDLWQFTPFTHKWGSGK
ncbi:putative phospholipase B-like 2 [Ixodes scapularis]